MYREIATKTLVGKGKLAFILDKKIKIGEDISKTLGCWIINLNYDTYTKEKRIFVKGSYDIQLWYASNNDQQSNVFKETITFDNEVIMSYRDLKTIDDTMFIKVHVHKYPTCIAMNLKDKDVVIKIDSLFYIDVFQEAILVVNCEDSYKEDIPIEEEIIMNVNPNYLEDK